MKKIILATVILVLMACTAYGITTWDRSPETSQKKAAVTAEKAVVSETQGPETCIGVLRMMGSKAAVRMYSTTLISEPSKYDLYVIEKADGAWHKKAYIRTIELPPTNNTREGKYKYYSENIRIDWLQKGRVYQLIPQADGNNHSSVPFWRKDV